MLNKMKITTNNHCSYCNGVIDFIEHFFFYCPIVRTFWKNIQNFVLAKYNVRINLNEIDILFGLRKQVAITEQYRLTINHILLVGKMCISIFKKTQRHAFLYDLFEIQLNIRQHIISKPNVSSYLACFLFLKKQSSINWTILAIIDIIEVVLTERLATIQTAHI